MSACSHVTRLQEVRLLKAQLQKAQLDKNAMKKQLEAKEVRMLFFLLVVLFFVSLCVCVCVIQTHIHIYCMCFFLIHKILSYVFMYGYIYIYIYIYSLLRTEARNMIVCRRTMHNSAPCVMSFSKPWRPAKPKSNDMYVVPSLTLAQDN